MSGIVWYPSDFIVGPTADHLHERSHQHQTFLGSLARRQPNQHLYPNYPDIDLRETATHYLADVELPGVRDPKSIECQWISPTSLVIQGEVTRPGEFMASQSGQEGGVPHKGSTPVILNSGGESPWVLVGERRIGSFRRHLTFPNIVNSDEMTANLAAGLLSLNIPKKLEHHSKNIGTVEIKQGS